MCLSSRGSELVEVLGLAREQGLCCGEGDTRSKDGEDERLARE
jgi:hypothetical protein